LTTFHEPLRGKSRRSAPVVTEQLMANLMSHARATNACRLQYKHDLFVETLKDIYYAEKHILKALPGMVKKAGAPELKKALETHHKETEGQIDRLEKVFKLVNTPARGKKCDAIEGILAEAKEQMEEIEDKYVLDAGMMTRH
jgi:ferritin-like metal-binding protein YciE